MAPRTERTVLPGSSIGILGGGQLGRMLAQVARRYGYGVQVYSPGGASPAGALADREWPGPYEDEEAVAAFAASVDVVTLEFENIPVETLARAAGHAPVRPGAKALHIAQNRLREKEFLAAAGFPVTRFWRISGETDLSAALTELDGPGILKTAGFGYDGKGQRRVGPGDSESAALAAIGGAPAVFEALVEFELELSVVAARGVRGEVRHHGVMENRHRNHILDASLAPAGIPAAVAARATEITAGILEALELVGTACVEFFLARDGGLLVNEIAPRPHNSGHLTIEASASSQFEQQLRAVCGLPLGDPAIRRPAAMVNLLGDLWSAGAPDWRALLSREEVALHLYGKHPARPGRKMGHLTVLGDTAERALDAVLAARDALS